MASSCRLSSYLVLLLAFIAQSSANTQFSNVEGSCHIYGDGDVYGKGIRISYYLQWASAIIGLWIAPQSANRTRVATSVITFSVFINSIRGAAVDNSLIIVEWYIAYYLVFWLLVFNLPTYGAAFKTSAGSLALILLNYVMVLSFLAWIYWRGTHYGYKEGCNPKVFLFTAINAYNPHWILASKILNTMGLVAVLAAFIGAIVLLVVGLTKWIGETDSEPVPLKDRLPLVAIWTFLLLIEGGFSIAFVEKTIQVNHIDFPGASLTDSGQLIPFLIGIFILASVFWEGLHTLVRASGR